MSIKDYDHSKIESKWQAKWEENKTYVPDISADKPPKDKFFNLWMFPYPSAEGLHAGHAFASTGSDIYGRFMRMQGKTVFQPIGYDSFGIHSENYAIKIGEDPHEVVKRTTKHYEEQMRSLGHGYDWTRTVTTSDPSYYKWTQWIFVKMFEAGLAYKKKATVNFCPSCKTVLADEQVVSPSAAGKPPKNALGEVVENSDKLKVCERCGTIVEKRDLDQWFFKITNYADRLLKNLDKIDWSENIKTAQRNWIGRSEGMLIEFKIQNSKFKIQVFTTRPDTLNAATFIALADEDLYNEENPEKLGKFTGKYAVNPLNGLKLPIWKTNYVAPGYGTGAVMGVPAHDERDMEFAKKYHLDIVEKDPDEKLWQEGEKNGWGKKHTNFHLRDWLVSRQRYWGAPIPMINCKKDGWVPVPEKDLPVLLPSISDYKPEGTGKGPLANHPDFYKVKCPVCGGDAIRETDVMDTFVDSSWYFLRYPSTRSARSGQVAFDSNITKAWLPVDLYFGGAEHAVLHLLYCRFVWMALRDMGYLNFPAESKHSGGPAKMQYASGWDEPITKFFAHGLMIKDGAKMSKSRGNVVNPDEYIDKYGADTLRLYEMFLGPMDAYPDFRDAGIEGMYKFIQRVWKIFNLPTETQSSKEMQSEINRVVKGVTNDIRAFKYNTAIAKIMQLVNFMSEHKKEITKADYTVLCRLLAPFAPHMTEEVWVEILGQPFSIHTSKWPEYDDSLIGSDTVTIIIQINGKMRSTLELKTQSSKIKAEVEEAARKDERVIKWLEGKKIVNTIFVPGKIINFVTD